MGMCDNHNNSEEENVSKRHLPPWMRNSVKNFTSETQGSANAEIALKKAVAGNKRETSRRKSFSAEGEVVVKRRRKSIEQDSGSDGNATHKHKKKKDASKRTSSKKKDGPIVQDPNCGDVDANSVQGFHDDDDDMELTMEDLMTIAEEYVNDHERKKQKEATNKQCESLKHFTKTGEYGNSLDSHCERQRLSTPDRQGLYSSTSNNTGELVPTRTSLAGDPAQEMLELLLGPLLKPLEKENNKSIIDSVEFTQELPGKNQVQFSGEDKVPLTKRKCSLKDKVGLFLD